LKDEAWSITTKLLQNHNGSTQEVCIFASQTLRHKVSKHLYKLDHASVSQLRDAIMQILSSPSASSSPLPSPALTQLCCSLAEIAIYSPPEAWNDPVGSFFSYFGSKPECTIVFLEFLTVLPEELLKAERLLSRDEYAEKFSVLVDQHASKLFGTLVSSLSGQNLDTSAKKKFFSCVESWLNTQSVPLQSITSSPIIQMSFEALSQTNDDELFHSAVSILSSIFEVSQTDVANQTAGGITIVQSTAPLIMQCGPLVSHAIESEDEDKVRSVVKLITSSANAFLPLITLQPSQFEEILNLMLRVTSLPYLDAVLPTFDFWFYLTESILDSECKTSSSFSNSYEQLIGILVGQLKYPDDADSWTAKDRDEFRDLRHEIGDVLKNCVHVLSEGGVLKKLFEMLHTSINLAETSPNFRWKEIESILFSVRAIGSVVKSTESHYVPQIFQTLPLLAQKHAKVRYGALLVCSSYSRWTSLHPEFIPAQMALISEGFGSPDVAPASARALKHLSQDASPLLCSYLEQLHPFYVSSLVSLPHEESMDVAEALAQLISSSGPSNVPHLLNSFTSPLVQLLSTGLDDILQLKGVLYRLSVFVKIVQSPRPNPSISDNTTLSAVESPSSIHAKAILDFMDALWPFLQAVLSKHNRVDPVTEGVSKVLRATLTPVCVAQYQPAQLQRLVELLASQYALSHYSCWLWVANHVVDQFSKNPQFSHPLFEMVGQLSQFTIQILEKEGFAGAFEPVDELYGILSTLMNVLTMEFLPWQALPKLVQLAISSVQHCDHPRTLGSVIYFLHELTRMFHASTRPNHIPQAVESVATESAKRVLEPFAADLTRTILHRRVVDDVIPPESILDLIAILRHLAILFPSEYPTWVQHGVSNLPHLNGNEKNNAIRDLSRAHESPVGRLRDILNRLAVLNFRRMEKKGAES
jgi:transportin-3